MDLWAACLQLHTQAYVQGCIRAPKQLHCKIRQQVQAVPWLGSGLEDVATVASANGLGLISDKEAAITET